MQIITFYSEGLSILSYMLVGENEAWVIDPERNVEKYLEEAKKRQVEITGILLTHAHADYVAGHVELREKTNAPIYVFKGMKAFFPHIGVEENDILEFENIRLKVLETPGHSPWCVSYVVSDLSRSEEPFGVFTGDTLFVGDVGRPDLFPEREKELMEKLYDSLFHKLLKLPDYVEIYPVHASGSLCGKSLSDKWHSTIGYEKKFNPSLQWKDKETFSKELLKDMPPIPAHFKRCGKINIQGPKLLKDIPRPIELDAELFKDKLEQHERPFIMDLRNRHAFATAHIPGAVNFDFDCLHLTNYAGWIVPENKPVFIVPSDSNLLQKAIDELRLTGLENPVYVLKNGIHEWVQKGFETEKLITISAVENMTQEKFRLIDIRLPEERNGDVEGFENFPVFSLLNNPESLKKDKPVFFACNRGARSSLAASYIKHLFDIPTGFVLGGMTAIENKITAGS